MQTQHNQSQPRRFAFFDVDDTLISVKSMLSFQDYWYQRLPDKAAENAYRQDLATHLHPGACWAELNRLYYRHFAGRRVEQVESIARDWYETMLETHGELYHPRVVERLAQHQREGTSPVFVSGSFPALLQPIAEHLGVGDILAIRMETIDGYYSGRILPPQTIGEGKAEAIEQFLASRSVSAASCYAYGDDVSDLPMLQAVGHPTIVTGGRGLEQQPQTQQWERLSPV